MRGFARCTRLLAAAVLLVAAPSALRAQDHDHEHEHEAEEADPSVRHLEHARHHGGFPEFVDIFFTHHAYLERKIHPRFAATTAEEGNEFEESAELAWQFNDWFGAEIEVPLAQTDPDEGDGAGGLGDIEIGPQVAFVQDVDRLLIVSARSGFGLPTGDEDEGLGADGWTWEPGLLVWKGFGSHNRGAVQAELTYERFFPDEDGLDDEEELVYNLGFSYWTPSNFIPVVELNGSTRISDEPEEEEHEGALVPAHGGGGGEDDTLVSATVGFRYGFANGQQWGAGIQLPLTDTESFDARFVVGGIIHLD